MPDSIRVLDPGWRALDANGDPFSDAVLSFFNAGTDDERTVYSDSDLSTSLGTEVDCNAGGEPVTSVNNPTLIYTGTTAYKVTISSAIAGYSRTFDDVLGALDTSSFLTQAAVADRSVVPVSTNRSVTTADKGKILDVNCTGGDITLTFDDAATLNDGFYVAIRHNGTANQVRITGDGSDTFGISGANVTGFSLTGRGQGCTVTCDATNFKTDAWTPPLIGGNTGVILIADRLSTPAGSPEAGQRYIVGSSPTGAWSGFAEHDIAEADGFGTWFNYTPATDCGWIAYVQDEDRNYQFQGSAWVLGLEPMASQAEQEAATEEDKSVAPATQHYHPGHPKFWAMATVSGGTPTLQTSYNVTSITDSGTGLLTVTIATDFSSANWCCGLTVEHNTSASAMASSVGNGGRAAGTVVANNYDTRASTNAELTDPTSWHVSGLGDQA